MIAADALLLQSILEQREQLRLQLRIDFVRRLYVIYGDGEPIAAFASYRRAREIFNDVRGAA